MSSRLLHDGGTACVSRSARKGRQFVSLWVKLRETHRRFSSASIYRMTDSQLESILERLEMLAPQRRFSDKRARLAAVRERLLSLHARGHSWRAIAREISSAGEKVSADLLRSVCAPKAKRRSRAPRKRNDVTMDAASTIAVQRPAPAAKIPDARFGAKGLKL